MIDRKVILLLSLKLCCFLKNLKFKANFLREHEIEINKYSNNQMSITNSQIDQIAILQFRHLYLLFYFTRQYSKAHEMTLSKIILNIVLSNQNIYLRLE